MARLLYIEASPRKDRSRSTQVARTFLAAYQKSRPGDSIETLDLWATSLPRFDGATIEAKYAILQGQAHTPGQAQAWKSVVDVIERFKSADKYLFSLPMWNFGVPYVFKHYIDVLVQPGLTFSFDPQSGYKGLVTGKKARRNLCARRRLWSRYGNGRLRSAKQNARRHIWIYRAH
jgi:FMN-dependent NADH-azoreductase